MRATAMVVAPICLISVCLKAEGHRIDAGPDHHLMTRRNAWSSAVFSP
jgi:hypothetical protein